MRFEARIGWAPIASLLALASAGAGCGGFVESGGEVRRLTVGAEGGALTTDGFALVVAPHALTATVTLSAQRASGDSPAGPAITVGPAHVTFDPLVPAEVSVQYDAVLHPHPADVFAAILLADGWHTLSRPTADPGTAGAAHGLTTSVGTFGVVDCPGGVCHPPDAGSGDDAGHD